MERVVINGRGYYIGRCPVCNKEHKQRVDYKGAFICSICRADNQHLQGDKIGEFTFTGNYEVKKCKGKTKRYWTLICSCGNQREYSTNYINSGKVNNCGCKTKELISESKLKHGLSQSRIYNIWSSMKKRCHNKNSNDYINYGGKGITVCDEWLNSPEIFYEWAINNGYKSNLTIDRIDNTKGYTPTNCQWITNEVNARKDKVKLTENQKNIVCQMFKDKHKQKDIAIFFKVSLPTIQRILKDKKCSRR